MIYTDLSNEDYHKVDSENFSVSSSQLKDMLEDPEVFYRKYITKEIARESNPAFDVGAFFHTAVLEPHKLAEECAVYSGIRRGDKWEKFLADNPKKAIITSTEFTGASRIIESVQCSKIAMDLLSKGAAEVSCFENLYVGPYEIMAMMGDTPAVLGRGGWEKAEKEIPENYTKIVSKVRADYIREKFGDISDLKSCSGNVKNDFDMRGKVSAYSYDMSAAYYLDIFSLGYGKLFNKFNWIFASKDMGSCQTYRASPKNILIGRAKWSKAIIELGHCIRTGWKFEERIKTLEPSSYENQWLETKGEEVLLRLMK